MMMSSSEISIILPPKGLRTPNWRQLWSYRNLLGVLIWRDIRVRYRQTLLGVAWVLIQPIFSMVVFSIFLGRFSGVPSDEIPYPLFSYMGILCWTYFSSQLNRATGSLVGNAQLINKVYFPRLILPLSSIVPGLLDFFLGLLFGIGLLWYFHWPLHLASSLLVLPILILMISLVLGLSFWLGIFNIRYRDVSQALPFLLQIWMFATPIVYPMSVVPQKYRLLVALNPMTGIVEGFRSALLHTPWNETSLFCSTAISMILFTSGILYFQKQEPKFADQI